MIVCVFILEHLWQFGLKEKKPTKLRKEDLSANNTKTACIHVFIADKKLHTVLDLINYM